MAKMNKSIWGKMAGYASGGEMPEEEEDGQVTTPVSGIRELASQMLKGAPTDAATTQPVIPAQERVPATNKENAVNIREQLQQFLNKQMGGSDNMQQLSDLYKKQLAQEGGRRDLSGLNALADHYFGTSLAKTFAKPPTELEQTEKNMAAQEAVNKSRQPISGDLLKEYGSDNNTVAKEQANYYRGLNSTRASGEKEEKNLDTAEEHMAKAMNPMSSIYGSGGSNLGQRLARARSVTALIRQHPDYQVDPREQKDMALSVASLLSNQNRVPYELVQSLVPKTWKGTLAGWGEYIANNPQSTDSVEFVKRMMKTVQKEQETAAEQIGAIQDQQAEGFNHLAVKRPERYEAHLRKGKNYLSMPGLDKMPGLDEASGEVNEHTPPSEGARLMRKKSTGEKWWQTTDGKKIAIPVSK